MPSWFQIKTDVGRYQRQLQRLSREAFPQAMADTVNTIVKAVDSRSHRLLRERMTLRNTYTERSLKVSLARVRSSGGCGYGEVGSISPYLPLQETGGRVRARRSRIAIPTTGVRRGRSKRGVVISTYRLNKIGRVGRGSKFFYANLRKPGIYTRKGKQLLMVRDLSMRSVRVPPTRWHSDAVKQFGKRALMEQVFIREAKKRLGKIK